MHVFVCMLLLCNKEHFLCWNADAGRQACTERAEKQSSQGLDTAQFQVAEIE